jgi:hypothetical protein
LLEGERVQRPGEQGGQQQAVGERKSLLPGYVINGTDDRRGAHQ